MLSILSPSAEAESNEPKSWALYPILGILIRICFDEDEVKEETCWMF